MNQRLLSTPRFSVERREFARPDGDPITRYVVVHPGAVVILPILPDGRIVMIRQVREAVDCELWELPAGTREPTESPIETAARELVEETGYRAADITPLVEFFTSPGVMTERMHAFLATGLEFVGQALEDGEQIVVETMDPRDLRHKLIDGQVRDGKTLAVLGLYFIRLQRRPME